METTLRSLNQTKSCVPVMVAQLLKAPSYCDSGQLVRLTVKMLSVYAVLSQVLQEMWADSGGREMVLQVHQSWVSVAAVRCCVWGWTRRVACAS